MRTATETIWPMVMKALDFEADADLMAMHFGEFEEEAENVRQLLTVMRGAARQGDAAGTQDAAAELVIANSETVVRYAASLTPVRALFPADDDWAAALAEVERLAAAEIAAHGAFRVATHAGVFVCS